MNKIQRIIEILKPDKILLADKEAVISKVVKAAPQHMANDTICWVGQKYGEILPFLNKGTIICHQLPDSINPQCNYLLFNNPRKAFQELLNNFFKAPIIYGIHQSAFVNETVKSNKKVVIGINVVIEENVEIGTNVSIGHNTVVYGATKIGNNVTIGSNCTIGGVGFGYEKDENGSFQLIQHIGGVEICDDVEIGNNTCIDKGVLENTLIGSGTKIDNLVHIAHNVIIGKNCAIIANSMIGGSTIIEEGSWIAPSAALRDGIIIKKNCIIGLGATLTKSTNENEVWAGNPAKFLKMS